MMSFEGLERHEIALDDAEYPPLLAQIPSPPQRLFVIGSVAILQGPSIGVVGARKATPYGLSCTSLFASRAAALGLTIVSGAAIGCDQQAAMAALAQRKPTIAVLAGGADVIYPKSAARLLHDIAAEDGAVVSEKPWGTESMRPYFVQRNRIIAGLSRATLIVEAGLGSGTFSTADFALGAGREVLVVPGSIHSPESKGSNRLLFQGAQPIVDIESFDAVLGAIYNLVPLRFGKSKEDNMRAGLTAVEARLVAALAANPLRLEQIVSELDMKTAKAVQLVSKLEAFGVVERFRDGRYGVPLTRKRKRGA